jgi:hypothetical protein
MPFSRDQDCERFGYKIMQSLDQGMGGKEICMESKMCPSEGVPDDIWHESLCHMCDPVMRSMKRVLTNNNMQEMFSGFMSDMCGLLFDDDKAMRDVCNAMLEPMVANVMETAGQLMAPNIACPIVLECPMKELERKERRKRRSAEAEREVKSQMCNICKGMAKPMKDFMANETAKDTVHKMLHRSICKADDNDCKTMINTGYEILWGVAGSVPDMMCPMLDMCPRTDGFDVDWIKQTEEMKKNPGMMCGVCNAVLDPVQEMMSSSMMKETLGTVTKSALELCDGLEAPLKSLCKKFAPEFLDNTMSMAMRMVRPGKMCLMMGACRDTKNTGEGYLNECNM